MALTPINLGSAPNDGRGDNLRTAGEKINANFDVVEAVLGTIPTGIEGAGARSFANVAALLATNQITYSSGSNQVVAGNILRTMAEGHIYEVQASTVPSPNGVTHLNVNGVGLIMRRGRLTADCQVQVPVHFSTMQAAVNYYAQLTPGKQWFEMRVNTGFEPTSGMVFEGHDFSRFRIMGQTTNGAPNPSSNETAAGDIRVSTNFTGNFIHVLGCPGPRLGNFSSSPCVVNMRSRGGNGILLDHHSSITVGWNSGVIYAAENGLSSSRSSIVAIGAVFRHCGISGMRLSMATSAEIRGADCSWAGYQGNSSPDAGIGIFVSRNSSIHADTGGGAGPTKANNCAKWGLRVHRAYFSGWLMEAQNNGEIGVRAAHGAIVNLLEARLSNNPVGVRADDLATVTMRNSTCNNSGTRSVECWGARIDARNANCRRNPASDGLDDFRVYQGGEILAWGAQGGSRNGINNRTENGVIRGQDSQTVPPR